MKAIDPKGGGHGGTEYTSVMVQPTYTTVKPSKGDGGKSAMIDGPYGGKKPQS